MNSFIQHIFLHAYTVLDIIVASEDKELKHVIFVINPSYKRENHDVKDNIAVPYANTRIRKKQ